MKHLNRIFCFSLLLVLCCVLASVGIAESPSFKDAEAWTCVNGHEGNTGNFCSECGAPRPTPTPAPTPEPTPEPTTAPAGNDGVWTCANGHEGNTGKFCTECGAPKPAIEEWTCENGHGGNKGNYCSECGAPKPAGTQTVPQLKGTEEPQTTLQETMIPPQEEAIVYNNPFPTAMERFNVPFTGTYMDHIVAVNEFLSYTTKADEHYAAYDSEGIATDQLAWTCYKGNGHSLYILYQTNGTDVYAYAYSCEYPASRRQEWAEGTLIPSLTTATGAELWVESGEDNDLYSEILEKAQAETDYETTKKLLRNPDPNASALWFSHRLTFIREEIDSKTDRYWIVFHNCEY